MARHYQACQLRLLYLTVRMHIFMSSSAMTDTQEQVITFKKQEATLELDGWREGDLAFSFRTAQTEATLLHQTGSDSNYFKIAIRSEKEIEFAYTVNGVPRATRLITANNLNSGEWQKVRVDYDGNHMRFTVNVQDFMIDLAPGQTFGPFDGPLTVGGEATRNGSDE